ncbi:transmembrane protein 135-like [Bolinopsis microptera]|uniref:transmembrane protein 135-like n=1 Tax=Bolinopsis microptera TaxID=2820187 RepID=UPI003079F36D
MIPTTREKIECLLKTAKSLFVPGVYGLPCSKLWHPDHRRCDMAGLQFLSVCSVKAVKIYTALYLLPQLLKHKSIYQGLKKTFPDVIRSAAFLTCHCYITCAAHCVLRRLLGHYRAITVAFIPSAIGSLATINIEKYHRQEILAIYMASLALECLYEMAVYRGLIPQLKGGEVVLFSLSSAVLVHFHRNKEVKINDTLDWMMSKLLDCKHQSKPAHQKYLVTRLRERLTDQIDLLITSNFSYPLRSDLCTHEKSCIAHTLDTGLNGLIWGTIIQMCLRLLSSGGSLRQVMRLFARRSDLARVSSFVGAYSASVVALECLFHKAGIKDITPALSGAVSGLLFAIMPEPSGPVALYFFCRAFQGVYKKLIQDKVIPEIPYDTVLLFTLSTAITIHTGVCEPHLMRPSYTAFLNYLTDQRYEQLDRQLINEVMKNTVHRDAPNALR